jgi:hypothetical protein
VRGSVAGPLVLVGVDNYVTFNGRTGYRVLGNVTVVLTARQFNAPRLITNAGPPTERELIASVTVRF